jgi:hypothetical protein
MGPAGGKLLVKTMADTAAIWISPSGAVETVSSGPQIMMGPKSSGKVRAAETLGGGTQAASK